MEIQSPDSRSYVYGFHNIPIPTVMVIKKTFTLMDTYQETGDRCITQLAKMGMDPKCVELTADLHIYIDIYISNYKM